MSLFVLVAVVIGLGVVRRRAIARNPQLKRRGQIGRVSV